MPAAAHTDVWTVSDLTRRVKDLLETGIGSVWLAGEISNWTVSAAGHAYFTLKDDRSQIGAVMFRGPLGRLHFDPANGLDVVVMGLVSVYEKRGNYQIICEEMLPKGVGALQLAFEKLKAKLDAEGIFDQAHKKPLPLLPRRIGIVTSPTGAAIRDILNVISRRFANVHILLYPARVQGEGAADEIVEGIRGLDAYGVDVMIVGRGGGSLEDLWSFNEEKVVRAVYAAKTPIISAVGHEIDYSLTDFAADVRAPTPSAAAELVVQEQRALVERVEMLTARMGKALRQRLSQARSRLNLCQSSYTLRRPEDLVRQRRQMLDDLHQRMHRNVDLRMKELRRRVQQAERSLSMLSPDKTLCRVRDRLTDLRQRLHCAGAAVVERARSALRPAVAQLHALSPLAVLARGYALAWKLPEGELVRDAQQLAPEDLLRLRLGNGSIIASVERIEDENHG